MKQLLSCQYNIDTACVEAKFSDGMVLAIDCDEVEGEFTDIPVQRAELDWLVYNKPSEYARLVLSGDIKHYLSLGCDHGILED